MPIKVFNYLATIEAFQNVVKKAQGEQIKVQNNFNCTKSLESLKGKPKKLSEENTNSKLKAATFTEENLLLCQFEIDADPSNMALKKEEQILYKTYLEAAKMDEIARQKSRIQWHEN